MKNWITAHWPRFLKQIFQRVVVVSVSILAQLIVFALMLLVFRRISIWIDAALWIISMLAALFVISKNTNPAYKIAWLVPILLFPVFGGMFYLLLGGNRLSARKQKQMNSIETALREALIPQKELQESVKQNAPDAAMISQYVNCTAGMPLYTGTKTTYFSLGDDAFPVMLRKLAGAKEYIYLEYFIIGKGLFWDSVLEILKKKAEQGLDIRVMYDDFGCIKLLPANYFKKLEEYGIKSCVFAPYIPVLSARLNNRDHRKLMIIDGKTGFTGGINLADEYINRIERFGHWKDNAIMLEGEAVQAMTIMFLSLWEYTYGEDCDLLAYPRMPVDEAVSGYVQPYTDSPLDDEAVGGSIYNMMISRANQYIYIMTPYLIIDHAMTEALCNAAKAGVDVRIITPHIPDKPYVHALTRSHYNVLIRGGVRIFEYTPGFIHSKTFLVDGRIATVGTVNLDFRSLYLHFENGVILYDTDSVSDIYEDFRSTFEQSQEITLEQTMKTKWYVRFAQAILRLIAPLM